MSLIGCIVRLWQSIICYVCLIALCGRCLTVSLSKVSVHITKDFFSLYVLVLKERERQWWDPLGPSYSNV